MRTPEPREFGTVNARNLTPWRPGQSGNPSGRRKGGTGFAKAIREESKDGRELWEFAFSVMRGQVEGASLRDRMDAMKWLADRGFGKVPDAVELEEDNAEADEQFARAKAIVDAMSPEELRANLK